MGDYVNPYSPSVSGNAGRSGEIGGAGNVGSVTGRGALDEGAGDASQVPWSGRGAHALREADPALVAAGTPQFISSDDIYAGNQEALRGVFLTNEEGRKLNHDASANAKKSSEQLEIAATRRNDRAAHQDHLGTIKKVVGTAVAGVVSVGFGVKQIHSAKKSSQAGDLNRELTGYKTQAAEARKAGDVKEANRQDRLFAEREFEAAPDGDHGALAGIETRANSSAMAAGGMNNAVSGAVGGIGEVMQSEDQLDSKLNSNEASRMSTLGQGQQWLRDSTTEGARRAQDAINAALSNMQQASNNNAHLQS